MRYGYRDKKESTNESIPSTVRSYVAEGAGPRPLPNRQFPNEEGSDGWPLARMSVQMGAEIPITELEKKSKPDLTTDGSGSQGVATTSYQDNPKKWLFDNAYMNDQESEKFIAEQQTTPQMFINRPAIITDAITHPFMKSSVVTLGALASKDAGGNIMASPDLSVHSSRLTQKAMKSGLVRPHPANPTAKAVNDIELDDLDYEDDQPVEEWDNPTKFDREFSQPEVRRAKVTALEAYTGKKRTLSPQFAALNQSRKTYNPQTDSNAMQMFDDTPYIKEDN
jgi:hypothetical protein